MPKNTDWTVNPEVKSIMEGFIEKFPKVFEGFDINGIRFTHTLKKKSKKAIKLTAWTYPTYIHTGKPYHVETFETKWKEFSQKQKNLAVFHVMCGIPEGGFDENSADYAKKVRPQIEMYMYEFAVCGGVPNWEENPLAKDPMEVLPEVVEDMFPDEDTEEDAIPSEEIERSPVTPADIASVA